eukprot:TRINITY_DN18353_c0_g1_i1.p1 TRINITY_DN18353_c0_g1~~TRINITY_DN18353_c0_g1_i1.p1  ORF type:complete len:418 (+),score=112.41 TRINITY_DN18353_c0_g1_i1:91-1344(+)
MASLQSRLEAVQKEAAECRTNTDRRRCYAHGELLRLDVQESSESPEEKKDLEHRLDDVAAQLSIRPHVRRERDLVMVIRLVGTVIYMLTLGIPLLAFTAPLRWLGTLLRKVGWKANSLPADAVQRLFTRGFLACAGVALCEEGLEHLDIDVPRVVMYAHASNLDPFCIGANAALAPKFVGKRVLFWVPLLGWAAWLQGHIPIDRSNLESAKRSYMKVKQYLQQRGYSVAIAPEGTRSTTGLLLQFKKGPFHTAKQVELGTQPVVLFNNYELWPPGQLFARSGLIGIRYLPAIPYEDVSIEEHMRRVRRVMLNGLLNEPTYITDPKVARWYRRGTMFSNHAFLALMLATPLMSITGVIQSAIFVGVPHALCSAAGIPVAVVFLAYGVAAAAVGIAAALELRREQAARSATEPSSGSPR